MKSKKKRPTNTVINKKEARQLRALGHHLSPLAMLGREGAADSVLAAINDVLRKRELIKIKIQNNCPLERQEAAAIVSSASGSAVVQVIGHMILLYRPNPDLPAEQRIRF
ncbi:MAG TPA: YhbY family RNA-binding protein [Desulfobacterales bacterium]|nr:YhbY family RNA-binding protein [Desulfobacterales bacterium]